MNKLRRLLSVAILIAACFVITHTSAAAQTLPSRLPDSAVLWRAAIDGNPRGLAVDEETGRVYVAKWEAEQIAIVQPDGTISTTIDTPATLLRQWGPEAVAFDPQTKRLFSVETNGDVTITDTTTNTIIKKRTFGEGGGWPMTASIAVDRVGRRVISTIRFGTIKKLVVLDADSLAVAATYNDGGDILGMAANDKTHIAYTGITTFNADQARQGVVLGIDLLNKKMFPVISGLPDGPANFVADSRTNLLYAAAASEGLLYVIDTQTNELAQTIDVPAGSPFSDFLALDSADGRLYCTAQGLLSIDIKTNEVVFRRILDSIPTGLAYDSTRKRLYVLDDTGLTAIDATQIETPELPATGGPPVEGTGANEWLLLGGFLTAIGSFILWRSFPRRKEQLR